MKASVLGIGTELVDGQIVNKNAAWISKKLKSKGMTTALHLVVPDEKQLMLQAIDFCADHSDLIFVTGGLGPTSDDFTRDIVAEWAGKSLHFDEASWQHIKERLEPRGFTVKEIQRQQCYFPEGSQILQNTQGTANAFYFESKNKKFFILPGPPREIEAVWDSYIDTWLDKNTSDLDPAITRHWDTIGVGESDIALIVEDVLKDITAEKGYRVHLPYVEVKLSFRKSEQEKFAPYIEKLTTALSHCLICRDQQDISELFAQALKSHSSMSLLDAVTGTYLLNRITPVTRDYMNKNEWSFSNKAADAQAALKLSLSARDEFTAIACIEKGTEKFTEILETPYSSALMKERRLQYFAELAMIFWLKHL